MLREAWLPWLACSAHFKLVGVLEPDVDARAALHARDPILRFFESTEALLASNPNLILVATPNHLHAALAHRLLSIGIPTVVEKPVCIDLAGVEKLESLSDRARHGLFLSAPARFRLDIAAFCDQLRAGVTGPPRELQLHWVRARGIPRPGTWFTHRATAGGGVLIDLGWHLLDLIPLFVGEQRFEVVAASVSDSWIRREGTEATWREDVAPRHRLSIDVEDTAYAILVGDTGVMIHMHCAWASEQSADNTQICLRGDRGELQLNTTFGYSPVRASVSRLMLHNSAGSHNLHCPTEPVGAEYGRQVEWLAEAVNGNPTARTDPLPAIRRIVGWIEAIYRLAETTAPAVVQVGPDLGLK